MPERPDDAPIDAAVSRTLTRLSLPHPRDPSDTVGRTSPPPAPFEAGATDRFTLALGDVLGEGGMGVVSLARQASLDRTVAVKSLHAGIAGPDTTRMLLRESRIMGRLEHPNIVPVHGLAWDDTHGPRLVMKRIEGTSWRAQLGGRRGLDRLEHHLGILATVAQALHFAHSRGVIHRDVKPANVMVGEFGEVYLVDWGVARLADDPPDPEDALLGSPAYAAPEMVVGGVVDARTDVFLLGSTLHFILTGDARHRGPGIEDVLRAAARAEPQRYGPDVPDELAQLCNRTCARDPSERPPTALAFRDALQDHLRHRASIAVAHEATGVLQRTDDDAPDRLLTLRNLATARFGFEQALREWPENPGARHGLQQCLRRTLELEFKAGNLHAAELLAAELPADPAVARRIEVLRARVARREQLAKSLASLRRDLQLGGAGWGRSLVSLVTGTASGLYIYGAGVLVRRSGREPTFAEIAAFFVIGSAVTVAGLFAFRRHLMDNRIYRRLMTAFALTPLLLAGGAWFGLRTGADFEQLVFGGIYMMTSFALILATVVSPVFWVTLGLALGVGWFATQDPTHAVDWAAIGWTVQAFWIAWALRPSGTEVNEG